MDGGGQITIRFHVPGSVVPWARAGRGGGFTFTPAPQRDYMATIKQMASDAMLGKPPIDGPVTMKVVAVFPWPKSMSARKRALPGAERKASRPDLDNLVKIVKDALNLVVYSDDAQIADLHAWKKLGDRPGLTVEVLA